MGAVCMLVVLCLVIAWVIGVTIRAPADQPVNQPATQPASDRSTRFLGRWGNYLRLADRYQGRVVGGGLWRTPRVEFSYGDAQASLHVGRVGSRFGPQYTELTIDWPNHQLACDIQPAGFGGRLRWLFGRSGIRTGVARFDREFVVQGNDPEQIQHLLTGGVQHGLVRLRDLRRERHLQVEFGDGELVIRKRGKLRDYHVLSWFVALGLELYDQALLVERTELTFVPPPAGEQRVAVCKVCGEETVAEIVYCRRCQTPHHRDCWRYFGACSVYACGETRFLTARQASRRAPISPPAPPADTGVANQ